MNFFSYIISSLKSALLSRDKWKYQLIQKSAQFRNMLSHPTRVVLWASRCVRWDYMWYDQQQVQIVEHHKLWEPDKTQVSSSSIICSISVVCVCVCVWLCVCVCVCILEDGMTPLTEACPVISCTPWIFFFTPNK